MSTFSQRFFVGWEVSQIDSCNVLPIMHNVKLQVIHHQLIDGIGVSAGRSDHSEEDKINTPLRGDEPYKLSIAFVQILYIFCM